MKKLKDLIKQLEEENKSRYDYLKNNDMEKCLRKLQTHKHNYTAEIILRLKSCLN